MAASAVLDLITRLEDEASDDIESLAGSFDDLDTRADSAQKGGLARLQSRIGAGLKTAAKIGVAAIGAVTIAAAGITVAAVDVAGEFEDATAAIIEGTGASGESLAEMESIVKGLAGTSAGLNRDLGELGAAVAQVNTRTGLSGDILAEVTNDYLQFSRVTGKDVVESVNLASRVLGDWGVDAEQTGQILDMLHGAGQAFGIEVDDLARKVVQFGAPMRQMGFTLEESIALFGKWEQEGVNAELAIGSLRIAAGRFAREGVDLEQGLRDTMDAIRGAKMESEGLNIAMETFGARAGPDMAAAIREGRFELDAAIEALRGTSGGLDDAAERTLKVSERFQILKNRARVALIPIGEGILTLAERALPALETAVDAISDGVAIVQDLARYLGFVVEEGDALNDFLVDLPPSIQPFVQTVGELIALFIDARTEAGGLKTLLLSLIPPSVLAQIADLRERAGELGQEIQSRVMPTIENFRQAWVEIGPQVIPLVQQLRAVIEDSAGAIISALQAVMPVVAALIFILENTLYNVIARLLPGGFQALKGALQVVGGLIQVTVGIITGALETLALFVRGDFTGAIQSMEETSRRVRDGLRLIFEGLKNAVIGILRGLIDGIIGLFEGLYNSIVGRSLVPDMVNDIIEWITTLDDRVISLTGDMKDDFIETVEAMIDSALDAFNVNAWVNVGKDIIDGLKEGAKQKARDFINSVTGVIDDALDAARQLLNIGSPARALIPFGESIPEGLAAGIQAQGHVAVDAIEDVARRIFQVVDDLGAKIHEGELAETFQRVGVISGLGSTAARIFEERTLEPMRQRIEDMEAFLENRAALVERARTMFAEQFGITEGEIQNFMARASFLAASGQATRGQVHAYRLLVSAISEQNRAQRNANALAAEYAEQQERILRLQEAQQRLNFLQQQVDLLELIQEQGLNVRQVLRGLRLGVDADAGAIVDAMTRAIEMVIENTEQKLGIASESKVFRRIGEEMVAGLLSPFERAAPDVRSTIDSFVSATLGVPASGLRTPQPVQQTTNQTTWHIHYHTQSIPERRILQDVQTLQMLRR